MARPLIDTGNNRLLRFEIETSADWKSLSEYSQTPGHDEVLFGLDELVTFSEQ